MRKRIFFIIIVFAAFVFTGGVLAQDDPRDGISALLNNILEIKKTGKDIQWSNAATGNSGKITITKTYILGRDTNCRDYARTTNYPNGGGFEVTGTGCRDSKGNWNLEEGAPKNIDAAKAPAPVKKPPNLSKDMTGPPPSKPSPPPPTRTAQLPPEKRNKTQSPPTVKKPHVEVKALKKAPVSLGGTIPSKSDDY